MGIDDWWDEGQHKETSKSIDTTEDSQALEAPCLWLAAELVELSLGEVTAAELFLFLLVLSVSRFHVFVLI